MGLRPRGRRSTKGWGLGVAGLTLVCRADWVRSPGGVWGISCRIYCIVHSGVGRNGILVSAHNLASLEAVGGDGGAPSGCDGDTVGHGSTFDSGLLLARRGQMTSGSWLPTIAAIVENQHMLSFSAIIAPAWGIVLILRRQTYFATEAKLDPFRRPHKLR